MAVQVRCLLRMALALAVLLGQTAPGRAATATAIYAFGTSLSDAGNLYLRNGGDEPVSPPYSGGRFSNGPTWVQDLGIVMGVPVAPSVAGGTDYAYGGAETGTTAVHAASPIDLPAQLAAFAATHPVVPPSALITLDIGANEIFDLLNTHASQSAAFAVLAQASANAANAVSTLAGLGARRFVVLGVPDLGKTPRIMGTGAAAAVWATLLSELYNQQLAQSLTAVAQRTGARIGFVDAASVFDSVIATPAAYGFTVVNQPCWSGTTRSASSGTVCSPVQAVQDQYVFWDGAHPTEHLHQIMAAQALTQIPPARR